MGFEGWIYKKKKGFEGGILLGKGAVGSWCPGVPQNAPVLAAEGKGSSLGSTSLQGRGHRGHAVSTGAFWADFSKFGSETQPRPFRKNPKSSQLG